MKRRLSLIMVLTILFGSVLQNTLIFKVNEVYADNSFTETTENTTGSAIQLELEPVGSTTEGAVELETEPIGSTTEAAVQIAWPYGYVPVWTGDDYFDLDKLDMFKEYRLFGSEYNSFFNYYSRDLKEHWDEYLRILFNEKLPLWVDRAQSEVEFEKRFIDSITQFDPYREYQDYELDGEIINTLFMNVIRPYFTEKVESIDFADEEFFQLDPQHLRNIDYMGINNRVYTDDIREDFLVNIYLDKLYDSVDEFLQDDWQEHHTKEYYQEVIYLLMRMKESGRYNGRYITNRFPTSMMASGAASENGELDESIEEISQDMESNIDEVSSRYGVYAGLQRSSISGDLLESFQNLIDNRRGIIGWYYTGVNSEDYDHDIGFVDDRSRLFQHTQLVALKLEERGANFDMRKTLYGLYDEQLSKETQDRAYFRGIKKAEYRAYMVVPETADYTFKAYLDDELYDSDGDFQVKLTLKSLDDEIFAQGRYGNWSCNLEENTIYKMEFILESLDSTSHLPDNIKLKWTRGGQAEEIVPNRYFILNENEELTSKENLDIKHLDPIGDEDEDGIPNIWEMEGFVVNGNTLAKYDPSIHVNKKVYYTSPVDKSTDGDPYSDLEEAIGANISGVTAVGKNPLIAAYPEIIAELQGITVNARMVNKFTQRESNTTASLTSTKNTTVNKHVSKSSQVKGFMVGVKMEGLIGYSFKGPSGGLKVSGTKGITAEGKFQKVNDTENTTTTISDIAGADSESRENLRKLASKIDSFKGGDFAFSLKLRNIGSAAAYKIKPNVSLYIGSEVGRNTASFATVQPGNDFVDLAPGMVSHTVNVETQTVDEGRKLFLTVTRETMEKLANGYPVALQMNNASSEVIVDGNTRGSWDEYVNRINGITATINHQDALKGLQKYKVFASEEEDSFRPQLSLGQALYEIYGDAYVVEDRTDDGVENPKGYINNKPITNINVMAEDIAELNELMNSGTGQVLNIFELPMRPSMIINIETADTQDTKPFIINTIYKRGKVGAYVIPNCSPVEEVKAYVTYDGAEHEVSLRKTGSNSVFYEYEFDGIKAIDIKADNRVVARDKNGNESQVKLYFAEGHTLLENIEKEAFGTGYVDLEEDYEITSNSELRRFIEEHPAESYIVNKVHVYVPSWYGATRIMSKEELLEYNSDYEINSYHPHILGYFTDHGDKYVPIFNKNFEIHLREGQRERRFEVFTGINDAKTYVVMVGNTAQINHEAYTDITLNGRLVQHKAHHSGAGMKINNLMFIEANENEPDKISGIINGHSTDVYRKYDMQVVGYFREGEGYNFKYLDESIDIPTFASNTTHRVERTFDGEMYKPKAYMIKIFSSDGSQRETVLKINGVRFARGARDRYSNENWMIVPVAGDSNKIYVDVINSNSNPVTNYTIEIVGYFY